MDVNEKTLKIFKGFINDLIKVFPEHKESLETNYNDVLNLDELIIDNNELIKEFLNNIDELSDDISNKNDNIFTDELFIVKDISMKEIWDSGISDRTKNSIWNYLQSFCLINITMNSNDKINEVLKSIESNEKVKDKKTLKDMKKIKKINDNLTNNNDSGEKSNMGDINNVLENTTIGNLAKEITEDLNLDSLGEDDMGNFFKPDNMMNIFQKINSTLTEKIGNNEIDGNALLGEASNLMNGNDMMNNMMGMFQNMQPPGSSSDEQAMPDLSNMMNMFQNMQQNQSPQQHQPQQQQQQQQKKQSQNANHDPNVVKERLRKKLDAKK
tara:strand:- start:1410 stop:2387 length:978 start_codon:yes stop_codon:yes gene_type:complete